MTRLINWFSIFNQSLIDKTIKKSNIRLVVSGDLVELYEYEKEYVYNLIPKKRNINVFLEDTPKLERRKDNIIRLRQKIKRVIEANVNTWGFMPLFCTFTFAENIEDLDQANIVWRDFMKRFHYFLEKRGFSKAKYLTVVEFQKRGAVHYHTIFFNIPFISDLKNIIADIWGQGFVKINAIDNIVHIGSYVCKYLQKGVVDDRLRRKKAFFTSRGLYRPQQLRERENIIDFLAENDTLRLLDTSHISSEKYGLIKYKNFRYENRKN